MQRTLEDIFEQYRDEVVCLTPYAQAVIEQFGMSVRKSSYPPLYSKEFIFQKAAHRQVKLVEFFDGIYKKELESNTSDTNDKFISSTLDIILYTVGVRYFEMLSIL